MTGTAARPRRTIRFAHTSTGATVDARSLVLPGAISRHWAWGEATGRNVRVCLIDSGVRAEDARGRVDCFAVRESGTSWTVEPDQDGDSAGHGTTCAAIIRRLAPDCDLVSVRVLGRNLHGQGEALLAALQWAIRHRFALVNLSLSTRKPAFKERLHDLADEAYFAGVTLVSAAHNSPVDSYPWRFPSVLSVGSHDAQDPEHIELSPDPPVEFFAPGVGIPAAGPPGARLTVSGNSFAAPHVTGLCARILQKHPGFRTAQLKQVLAGAAGNLR
ncbi:S8 family serine peptidase [Nonomuraea sp. NPDC052116]|uniref:S8 family serine peptidase n=1 Tax=Nonomuraea sp. NPDC052116 TaxID=3155665 RepID=UPI00343E9235